MRKQFSDATKRTAGQLNIIDDTLFRKMAEDAGFCEEVLCTILQKKISVLTVTEQQDIKNLQGRSVILDALCEDDTGKKYNIEIQKADDDDHQKRVRYNASCVTANFAKAGTKFLDIPDVIVVFISRFDPFRKGKTMYHIDRIIRETGELADNGFSEIYVNAAVRDGSDVSDLMEIFTKGDSYDFVKFPRVSARKEQFKRTERGAGEMCTIVDQYAETIAEKYGKKVKAKDADNIVKEFGVTIERACQIVGMTLQEYQEAKDAKEI